MALMWHTADLFMAADRHAERSLEEARALLARQEHLTAGFVISAMDVMLGIRSGDFAHAEELATACAQRGAVAGDVDAAGWYGGQISTIRWFQGRLGELTPTLTDLVNSPELSLVDHSHMAGLAVAAASAGDRPLAEGMLARLSRKGLDTLPRSSVWLVSMYAVAESAHLLGDARTAAQVYALLAPYARLPVVGSLGVSCFGSAHHPLGVAALTTGDLDRAAEHLRLAVRDNLALTHWPAVVLSRWRLGQALELRDGSGGPAAQREIGTAIQEAEALGMALPSPMRTTSLVRTTRRTAEPAVVCTRSGRHWRIELGERTALVEHMIGMRHLATLLANPGKEIPAVDLAAGLGTARSTEGSAQPVLDEQAKSTYKRRLTELQAEIDDLESADEADRAADVRTERDWLIAELAAAAGMNGRTRRFTGNEERARIAVGKAIRRALDRISTADPVIGEQLRSNLQTGLRCCYRPT
jgi:hypothetical protein